MPQPRIFVQIASYRDPECAPTIADLFAQAAHPERISVGVCWQYHPEEDAPTYVDPARPDQVRVVAFPVDRCEGVCWARRQTQHLHRGEEYTLVTDSHMRFVEGWDERMLAQLALCDAPKPLLSASPAAYTPPRALQADPRPTIRRARPFTVHGDLRCRGEVLDRAPERPLNGAFVAAGYMFSRAEVIAEVPYDPYLYFDQEEIDYALRLYTHGWDVFSPAEVLTYHFYRKVVSGGESPQTPGEDTGQRPLHWRDRRDWGQLQRRGRRRLDHLTDHAPTDDPEVLAEIDRYGLGTARSLADFERYTGIDFRRKVVAERGLRCDFIRGLARYRTRPIAVEAPSRPASPLDALAIPHGPHPGDFIPFFELTDDEGQRRESHLYAGRPCALLHLGELDDDGLSRLAEAWEGHEPTWRAAGLRPIFVLTRPVEGLRGLRDTLGLHHRPWADPQGALARRLGLDGRAPVALLLDANMRVVWVHRRADEPGVLDALATHAETHARTAASGHAPVLRVPRVLTRAQCEAVIERWRTGRQFDGKVGAGDRAAYRRDAKVRTDVVLDEPWCRALDALLCRTLLPEVEKVFGLYATHREEYKVGRYGADAGGKFRQHRDNFEVFLAHRRVAMTLNLNEGFEGGGLNFPEYGPAATHQAAPGEAIIFPCSLMHQVHPVTAGERFTLVSFFYGEGDAAYAARTHPHGDGPLRRIARDPSPPREALRSFRRYREG